MLKPLTARKLSFFEIETITAMGPKPTGTIELQSCLQTRAEELERNQTNRDFNMLSLAKSIGSLAPAPVHNAAVANRQDLW